MPHIRVEEVSEPARHDLPASLSRNIGRFIVAWAHFEYYVQSAVWEQLKLTHAQGRIAVRDPRVTDRLDMVRDLGQLRGATGDYVLLQSIRQRADKLATLRHLVAHGIWTKLELGWFVQLARGNWEQIHPDRPEYPKGLKAVTPECILIEADGVAEWVQRTEQLITDLSLIGKKSTTVQKSSHQKQQSQYPRRDQTRGRSRKRRKPPRSPSRESP